MNIRKNIGNRIRQCRAKLGLTQGQLAKALNTSKSSVSDWEQGDTLPKVESAIQLATMAEISLDWLFKGNETDHQPVPDTTPEEERLLAAFRRSDGVYQLALLKIAEKIADNNMK